MGHAEGAAQTCNQLAIVAEGAGRPDEAERWYKRAIGLGEEFGDSMGVATRSNNLANLYLTQNRLDEAEQYAERAREIKETLDLSSQLWTTYSILAQIADKRGRTEEARQWRKKAEETYAAYVDRSGGQANQDVRQWEPVIQDVVAFCNGNKQATQELEPFLQKMETQDDWRNLIPVIRRIMQGERDAELTEGLDHTDAAIVRRILGLLNAPPPPAPPPSTTGEGSGHPSPVDEVDGRGDGGEGEDEQQGITVEDILNLVVAGAKGDAQAGGQAYQIAQALQQDPNAPPEIRALGKGLQYILEGLRGDEAVRGLPPEAAELVKVVLAQL